MRRFLSCSCWGLMDVTDFPWCCPLHQTEVIDVFHVSADNDGAY